MFRNAGRVSFTDVRDLFQKYSIIYLSVYRAWAYV